MAVPRKPTPADRRAAGASRKSLKPPQGGGGCTYNPNRRFARLTLTPPTTGLTISLVPARSEPPTLEDGRGLTRRCGSDGVTL